MDAWQLVSEVLVRPSHTCMNFALPKCLPHMQELRFSWQVYPAPLLCYCPWVLLHLLVQHLRCPVFLAMGSCCLTQQPADSSDDHAASHVEENGRAEQEARATILRQAMTIHYDEEANSIIPAKPMLYPIKMKKGMSIPDHISPCMDFGPHIWTLRLDVPEEIPYCMFCFTDFR